MQYLQIGVEDLKYSMFLTQLAFHQRSVFLDLISTHRISWFLQQFSEIHMYVIDSFFSRIAGGRDISPQTEADNARGFSIEGGAVFRRIADTARDGDK